MDSNSNWRSAYDRLIKALTSLGFPAELGDMIARDIGSPKGIERMTSYLYHVRPESIELIADEMIAIKSDIDRWRDRKESLKANEAYNNVLNNGLDSDDEL